MAAGGVAGYADSPSHGRRWSVENVRAAQPLHRSFRPELDHRRRRADFAQHSRHNHSDHGRLRGIERIEHVIAGEGTPAEVVEKRGLKVVSDDGALIAAIDTALAQQPARRLGQQPVEIVVWLINEIVGNAGII